MNKNKPKNYAGISVLAVVAFSLVIFVISVLLEFVWGVFITLLFLGFGIIIVLYICERRYSRILIKYYHENPDAAERDKEIAELTKVLRNHYENQNPFLSE